MHLNLEESNSIIIIVITIIIIVIIIINIVIITINTEWVYNRKPQQQTFSHANMFQVFIVSYL